MVGGLATNGGGERWVTKGGGGLRSTVAANRPPASRNLSFSDMFSVVVWTEVHTEA